MGSTRSLGRWDSQARIPSPLSTAPLASPSLAHHRRRREHGCRRPRSTTSTATANRPMPTSAMISSVPRRGLRDGRRRQRLHRRGGRNTEGPPGGAGGCAATMTVGDVASTATLRRERAEVMTVGEFYSIDSRPGARTGPPAVGTEMVGGGGPVGTRGGGAPMLIIAGSTGFTVTGAVATGAGMATGQSGGNRLRLSRHGLAVGNPVLGGLGQAPAQHPRTSSGSSREGSSAARGSS